MKRFTLILTTALTAVILAFAGISSRYFSRLMPDGTLFFLNPTKLKDCHGISAFEYDITCQSWMDSVTVNFQFKTTQMARPADLCLISGHDTTRCTDYHPLYIDAIKGGYLIRITSRFPATALERMADKPEPPVFEFTQGSASCSATYTPGAWKKESEQLRQIFQIISYSRTK